MSENYGTCITCSIDLPTHEDATSHMRDTVDPNTKRSHAVRILNPTPEQRARRAVGCVVDDAITGSLERLERLIIRDGHTESDVVEALLDYPDFADAWSEYWDGGDS